MSEFAVARQFAGQLLAACDAIDKAGEAVERAKAAEKRVAAALAQLKTANEEATKAKGDADSKVRARLAELVRIEKEDAAARTAEKRKHEAWKEAAETEIQEKSRALSELNGQIADARKLRSELTTEIAKHRVTLTESAAKFANG